MTSNITYEEALSRCSSALRCKLEHSVQLIRKAERLAMNYDPDDGYFLAFSGGKDSQALYHVAVVGGVKFKAHMNLTSVDPSEVIRFVKKQYPDVALTKPKDSIYNIAVKMGILPTMRTRWCCQEFKEMAGAGKVTLIGIRKQESTRRAKRKEVEISNHKFQGTLEQLDDYREEQNEKRRKKRSQKRDGVNITNATDEKTLGCIHGKESLLISPIIDWTESDVWEFLNNVVCVPHCELYDQGWHRIGCINCPMASHKQKLIENERWPHVKRNWIKTITRIRCGGGTNSQTSYQKDIWRAASNPAEVWRNKMEDEVRSDVLQREQLVGGAETATSEHRTGSAGAADPQVLSVLRQWRVFGKLLVCRLDRGARTRNSREHLRLVDKRKGLQEMVCREIPANEVRLRL